LAIRRAASPLDASEKNAPDANALARGSIQFVERRRYATDMPRARAVAIFEAWPADSVRNAHLAGEAALDEWTK
jgi:hypothetical protein